MPVWCIAYNPPHPNLLLFLGSRWDPLPFPSHIAAVMPLLIDVLKSSTLMHGGVVRSRYTIICNNIWSSRIVETPNGERPIQKPAALTYEAHRLSRGDATFAFKTIFLKTLSNWAISHILWFFDYKRQVVSPTVVSVFNQRSIPQQTKHSNGFFQGITECVVSIS